ncbi:hypothetical protein MKW92_033489 [Papaver armeniacum]|nr:hypothetical protein MKW92_033489 [Papaver armeniacum]
MNYVPLKIIQSYQPNFKLAQKFSDKIFQQTQKSHSRYIKLGISLAESDLISSYCECYRSVCEKDRHKDAISLFSSLLIFNCTPTQYTFGTVIHSSITLQNLCIGEQFHACALKLGLNSNVFVGSLILNLYVKFNTIENARKAFDDTNEPNVVSYTTLVCGYLKNKRCEDVPEKNVVSWNAMIEGILLPKCGAMEDSLLIFGKLQQKNVVSWNVMIFGYAQNGRGKEALEFFEKMKTSGFRPNSVTLLCVLLACDHTGLVDEAFTHFNLAKAEDPNLLQPEHYAWCMVDLLSRCGRFNEAETFLQDLPFDPGIGFWKSLLGGCQIHSNLELADYAARRIHDLDPKDSSPYVMISNANSADGRWSNSSVIRTEMKEKGMTIIPGCSWIEANGKVRVFVTRDKRHVQKDEIYLMLRNLLVHMKVDHDIRNTEKP